MPFTEKELREILHAQSADAPSVEDLAERAIKAGRRARKVRAAATAATTCVLAAVAVTAPRLLVHDTAQVATPAAGGSSSSARPSPSPCAVVDITDAVAQPRAKAVKTRTEGAIILRLEQLVKELGRRQPSCVTARVTGPPTYPDLCGMLVKLITSTTALEVVPQKTPAPKGVGNSRCDTVIVLRPTPRPPSGRIAPAPELTWPANGTAGPAKSSVPASPEWPTAVASPAPTRSP
jgi:hypothetical protein